MEAALRIVDCLIAAGPESTVLIRAGLAVLKLKEKRLLDVRLYSLPIFSLIS